MDGELPERAEVVVVGGGIAGASVLWHLSRLGIQAVLLERERIAGGATSAAVGVLSPALRQPFHETAHDLVGREPVEGAHHFHPGRFGGAGMQA